MTQHTSYEQFGANWAATLGVLAGYVPTNGDAGFFALAADHVVIGSAVIHPHQDGTKGTSPTDDLRLARRFIADGAVAFFVVGYGPEGRSLASDLAHNLTLGAPAGTRIERMAVHNGHAQRFHPRGGWLEPTALPDVTAWAATKVSRVK